MRFRTAAPVLLSFTMPLAAQEVPPTRDGAITAPLVLPTTPTPAPTPTPTPAPAPDPVPAPPSPSVSLPSPVRPTPGASATVRVEPTARPSPSPTPQPPSKPTSKPTPAPAATPGPRAPTVAPVATTPEAMPAPAISSTHAAAPPADGPADGPVQGGGAWWLILPLFALIAAGWLMLRRSRAAGGREGGEDRPPAARPADPEPLPAAPVAPSVTLRPLRIGLNMLTATFEGEVTVFAKEGMENVRISLHLMAASRGEGQAIAALHDAPIGRTVVPAFTLASDHSRVVRAIGVLAREATGGLEAAGRPLFVPLVAVRLGWRDADGEHHQLTQAFAVGVERVDSPKLAPIWLDQAARSYDQIAARPHGVPLVREAAIVAER